MITGNAGVKYGLQFIKKQESDPQKTEKAVQNKANVASIFGDDDEEEDDGDVNRELQRIQAKKRADAKVAEMQAKALAEDPSIYDYDAAHDDIVAARQAPKAAASQRAPKYIQNLLASAKEREKEHDVMFERKQLREREKEEEEFGKKERYVTAAYKKKLEQDQKWLQDEEAREAREAAEDVTKRGDMTHFYQNLLTRNVALGTREEDKREEEEEEEVRLDRAGHAAATAPAPSTTAPSIPVPTAPSSTLPEPLHPPAAQPLTAPSPAQLVVEDKALAARERYLARKRKADHV